MIDDRASRTTRDDHATPHPPNYQVNHLIHLGYAALTLSQAAPLRPLPERTSTEINTVRRRDRLGGLLHEYQQVACGAPSCGHPQGQRRDHPRLCRSATGPARTVADLGRFILAFDASQTVQGKAQLEQLRVPTLVVGVRATSSSTGAGRSGSRRRSLECAGDSSSTAPPYCSRRSGRLS